MFRRFSPFRRAEQDLLAPLLEIARSRHGYDRRVWIDELRVDAPTVAARLEAILAGEQAADVVSIERPSPVRDRARALRELPLTESASRASVA